jgi:hypothetical protein
MPDAIETSSPIYEERYCAYIDILGFREMVNRLEHGTTPLEALRDLLEKIHNPPETNAGGLVQSDFRAQSISDAVALSAARNIAGLGAIIHSINRLAVDLLSQGFFIRGALVKDKLYHDDKIVLGKALVRAYDLESKTARYPRVMVTREVVDDLREVRDSDVSVLLRRADDGPMFVHVLRAIEMAALPLRLGHPETQRLAYEDSKFGGKLDRYIGISEQIQRRFDEATDNPNHFEKVKWFAGYWNDHVRKWDIWGLNKIIGPGLNFRPAVWG